MQRLRPLQLLVNVSRSTFEKHSRELEGVRPLKGSHNTSQRLRAAQSLEWGKQKKLREETYEARRTRAELSGQLADAMPILLVLKAERSQLVEALADSAALPIPIAALRPLTFDPTSWYTSWALDNRAAVESVAEEDACSRERR